MNRTELDIEMVRNGDNGSSLAEALGITPVTFSNKRSGKVEFTRIEIQKIIARYNLSAERMTEIFFDEKVS